MNPEAFAAGNIQKDAARMPRVFTASLFMVLTSLAVVSCGRVACRHLKATDSNASLRREERTSASGVSPRKLLPAFE
jgi:hypothetical protein